MLNTNKELAGNTVNMMTGVDQQPKNTSGTLTQRSMSPSNSIAGSLFGLSGANSNAGLESALAAMHREDWAITSPYLKQLLAESSAATSGTGIVDAARRQIQRTALGYNESVNSRQANRANIHLTPAQQLAMSSSRAMGAALNNTANVNTARINQYDANINALNRLIASTNSMKKGAASSLDQIAGNESNRRMQNEAAKAQAEQARNANTAAIASAAIMAAAMM